MTCIWYSVTPNAIRSRSNELRPLPLKYSFFDSISSFLIRSLLPFEWPLIVRPIVSDLISESHAIIGRFSSCIVGYEIIVRVNHFCIKIEKHGFSTCTNIVPDWLVLVCKIGGDHRDHRPRLSEYTLITVMSACFMINVYKVLFKKKEGVFTYLRSWEVRFL